MADKPKNLNSESAKQIDRAEKEFDAYDKQIKDLTLDRMNLAPKLETEAQHGLSQKEIRKKDDLYLKPARTISPGVDIKTGKREQFNEDFREEYNFAKEYVQFIAENIEVGGLIEIWTKDFPGISAEFWEVPCNRPVWGPRYLAENIRKRTYHRLSYKEDKKIGEDGFGTWTGQILVDNTINRLNARPVSTGRSVFMGANG